MMQTIGLRTLNVRFGTTAPVQRGNYLVGLKDGADADEVARKIRQELVRKMPMGQHLGEMKAYPSIGMIAVNASRHLIAAIGKMPEVEDVTESRDDVETQKET